ncbi:hypothetical protein Zmor_011906 [Zophobas morio]|uniref:Uncharacterized protein n=1 Tax=Zophobas morio TaxID=2755281 RepID=A0AA38LYU5_9CUCU|nr:hypothetical protein Zmor_011906 [Zophobas morio]
MDGGHVEPYKPEQKNSSCRCQRAGQKECLPRKHGLLHVAKLLKHLILNNGRQLMVVPWKKDREIARGSLRTRQGTDQYNPLQPVSSIFRVLTHQRNKCLDFKNLPDEDFFYEQSRVEKP